MIRKPGRVVLGLAELQSIRSLRPEKLEQCLLSLDRKYGVSSVELKATKMDQLSLVDVWRTVSANTKIGISLNIAPSLFQEESLPKDVSLILEVDGNEAVDRLESSLQKLLSHSEADVVVRCKGIRGQVKLREIALKLHSKRLFFDGIPLCLRDPQVEPALAQALIFGTPSTDALGRKLLRYLKVAVIQAEMGLRRKRLRIFVSWLQLEWSKVLLLLDHSLRFTAFSFHLFGMFLKLAARSEKNDRLRLIENDHFQAECLACALVPQCRGRGLLPEDRPRAVDPSRLLSKKDELETKALTIVSNSSVAREVSSKTYRVENAAWDRMNGSIEWKSILRQIVRSSVLSKASYPFTIEAVISGTASYVGFDLGPSRRILVHFGEGKHRVLLHVGTDGAYVVLKDGLKVLPEQLFLPNQVIPPESEVRLAAYGIVGSLISQQIRTWEGQPVKAVQGTGVKKFSVVVVCTKFARRLAWLLASIARQSDFSLSDLEVVVAFVPGLDATEDVLAATELSWPELMIRRVPMSAADLNQKGRMLNQCIDLASGERVLFTDADIVLPPKVFAQMDRNFHNDFFVAVSGRMMLSKESTARILSGLVDPIAKFDELLGDQHGSKRVGEAKGKPLGYFQCVRRECLSRVRYRELAHFEGADGFFAEDMRAFYGKEKVIDDCLVLHLDHEGSQWYGASRHF